MVSGAEVRLKALGLRLPEAPRSLGAYVPAVEAAGLATLNALSVVRSQLGTLDRIKGVVRLAVSLRTSEEFTAHPAVADAASELLLEVFGPGHTRLVFGVKTLPFGMCAELEFIFQLERPV